MLAAVTAALAFNVQPAVLPASTAVRAPAVSMMEAMETKFVYGPPKGPLSQNFAANMGDCAQISVAKGYMRRIKPATPNSEYTKFVYNPAKGPLAQNFAANMGDCAQIDAAKGYKRRIKPQTPNSQYTSFVYGAPVPLGRSFVGNK
eukprot:4119790-Prymnesium_polylepis.2